MTKIFSTRWLLGILTLSCLVGVVSAKPAAAQSDHRAAMVQAVASKEKALDSNLPEDWQVALSRFREVDTIQSTAETRYEIGVAASKLGEIDLAVDSYGSALELGLSGIAGEKARAYVLTQSPLLAQLRIVGPPGTRIFVLGTERARLPLSRAITVKPGAVTLEIVAESGMRTEKTLSLAAGDVETLTLDEPQTHPAVSVISSRPSEPTGSASTNSNSSRKPTGTFNSTLGEPPTNTRDTNAHRQTGWVLVAAGSSLAVLSTVSVIVSNRKVTDNQQALFDRCENQVNGPDSCKNAKPGLLADAQSASDAIATWKAVRTTSWVSLILGVSATVGGAALLGLTQANPTRSAALPSVNIDQRGFELSYLGAF